LVDSVKHSYDNEMAFATIVFSVFIAAVNKTQLVWNGRTSLISQRLHNCHLFYSVKHCTRSFFLVTQDMRGNRTACWGFEDQCNVAHRFGQPHLALDCPDSVSRDQYWRQVNKFPISFHQTKVRLAWLASCRNLYQVCFN